MIRDFRRNCFRIFFSEISSRFLSENALEVSSNTFSGNPSGIAQRRLQGRKTPTNCGLCLGISQGVSFWALAVVSSEIHSSIRSLNSQRASAGSHSESSSEAVWDFLLDIRQ